MAGHKLSLADDFRRLCSRLYPSRSHSFISFAPFWERAMVDIFSSSLPELDHSVPDSEAELALSIISAASECPPSRYRPRMGAGSERTMSGRNMCAPVGDHRDGAYAKLAISLTVATLKLCPHLF